MNARQIVAAQSHLMGRAGSFGKLESAYRDVGLIEAADLCGELSTLSARAAFNPGETELWRIDARIREITARMDELAAEIKEETRRMIAAACGE